MKLEYKRDQIKDGGKTIANIRRDKLCAGTGTTTLCNVKDDKVRKGTGTSTLCNEKMEISETELEPAERQKLRI